MAKKIETKVVKRTKVEKEMTLLRAIERVVEVSKDSKLKAEAKADMAEEVKYLAEHYGITERQNHTLDTPGTEAAWHQNAIQIRQCGFIGFRRQRPVQYDTHRSMPFLARTISTSGFSFCP